MKLVAKKDFANVKALGLTVDKKNDGFVHENVVHKGYRFAIGKPDIFDDLTENDKVIIVRLVSQAQVAVFDDDKNKAAVAKIDAEVKAENAAATAAPTVSFEERIAAAVALALKGQKAAA